MKCMNECKMYVCMCIIYRDDMHQANIKPYMHEYRGYFTYINLFSFGLLV